VPRVRWVSPLGGPVVRQVALGLAQSGEGEGERGDEDGRSYAPEDRATFPVRSTTIPLLRAPREDPGGAVDPAEQAVGHVGHGGVIVVWQLRADHHRDLTLLLVDPYAALAPSDQYPLL
jgi:hypothetical protein